MKTIILVAALSLVSTGAFAQATCKSRAAEQKLAGAALNSFMKKCETEANTACEVDSKQAQARRRRQVEPHEEVRHRRCRRLNTWHKQALNVVDASSPLWERAHQASPRPRHEGKLHHGNRSDGAQGVSPNAFSPLMARLLPGSIDSAIR